MLDKPRLSAIVGIWSLLITSVGLAQAAAPITQSGMNTQVSAPVTLPSGQTQYNITGGTRPGGGTNLFHSFGEFNVPTNNVANFLNDAGLPTSNILGRVTAGNPSVIYGLIQTNGPGGFGNANLFLMNPAGFLFGPGATLNVGGMVAFTTADYLRFQGTDTLFNNASTPESLSPLSIAPVAAFGFLGSNPAAIAIQGSTLEVAQGQSLSLVGGNKGFTATDPDNGNPIPVPDGITMTGGRLFAPAGQINIASVAGPGEISAVDFMPTTGMTMGKLSLSQGAVIDVSAEAAGTARIRGGQLIIDSATISADTANIDGASTAIDINVTGSVSLSQMSQSALTARTSGSGNAGDIQITSGSLNGTFGTDTFGPSLISSTTTGSGHGGNVRITTGPLTMNGDPSAQGFFIDTGTGGEGSGGNVTIIAGDAQFTNGGILTGGGLLFGIGNGGNLTIKADSLIMDGVSFLTDSFGARAGAISIETTGLLQITHNSFLSNESLLGDNPLSLKADHLLVEDFSRILTSTALGNGGEANITARIVEFKHDSGLSTQTYGDGDAGNITVTATEAVRLLDTQISGGTTGFFTTSIGTPEFGVRGNAGNITISTPELEMTGGAKINSTTLTAGRGGDVTITAPQRIVISGEGALDDPGPTFGLGGTRASGIYTRTVGSEFCVPSCGNAGNVTITTGSLTLQNGGLIDSGTTNSGKGGTTTVTTADQLTLSGTRLDGTPGGIFSRTNGTDPGSGNGGNIEVNAAQLGIANGAQISASTSGTGNAGNIVAKANDIAINGGGTITAASTGAGNAGTVTIQGLDSSANAFLVDGAGSGVSTNTADTGAGGDIFVNANTVTISNGSTLSAKTSGNAPSAVGGTITVDANAVNMTNGASITASSTGTGPTGNIQITAGNQFAMTNSTVTTEALQSSGGAIKITTSPSGTVELTNSTISASVLDGNGGGGSVNIDPQSVVLINSQILANAVFGPGGNINVTTNLLLPDSTSIISASSQFGQQGNVIIQSPISPASGKIIPLGQKPLLATTLLGQRCAAIAGGNISSFTVAGRDSLPAEPGGWISSPLVMSMSESDPGTVSEPASAISREMAEGTPLLSLRKIAPAGFLTQSFAVDSSECQSS